MEKDCGLWINVLSHKLKKRMNANMQSLGITGVQSRVMHYILVKCADGPVFQRDVESAFGMSRSTATGILQLMEKNDLILRESVASDARLKSLIPMKRRRIWMHRSASAFIRRSSASPAAVQRAAGAVSGNRRVYVRKPGRVTRLAPMLQQVG